MSLIGWWPLHRTQGKALDMSGNGNHGTHNGTTRGVAGVGGLQATSFSSNENISIPSFGSLSSFTVSGWARFNQINTSGVNGVTNIRKDNVALFQEKDGKLKYFARDNGGFFEVASEPASTDKWYQFVITYDGSKHSLYINGSESGSTNGGNTGQGEQNTLGSRVDGSAGLDGKIAGVRIYDRALSSSEIRSLYEWGSRTGVTDTRLHNGRDPGAVARYTLDGSAEDVWGPNNGTNNGATYVNDSIRGQAGQFQRSNTDGIDLPNLGISGDQAHTISAWVNFAGSLSQNQTIYAQGSRSTDNQIDFIYLGNRSQLVASFYNNDLGYTFNPATDVWYHIATTYDGSIRQLYFNGEVRASDSPSAPSINNKNYSIGYRGADTDSYLDGKIDDVRIYDRALSPSEVHQLYQWGTRGIDMRRKLVNKR
jgi:hypothetical protein